MLCSLSTVLLCFCYVYSIIRLFSLQYSTVAKPFYIYFPSISIGISQNTKCDNTVSYYKSSHILMLYTGLLL